MLDKGPYHIGPLVCEGISAHIHACTNSDNKAEYVAKVFERSFDFDKEYEHECEMLERCRHEGIINMVDTYQTDGGSIIVMEKGEEDLHTYLTENGCLSFDEIKSKLKPVFSAVLSLHNKAIVHCDVKAENIVMMKDGKCKLIDFGLADHVDNDSHCTYGIRGTFDYLAPEQHMKKTITEKVDVWAFGVVLHMCAIGGSPFDGKGYNYVVNVISRPPNLELLKEKDVTGKLTDLIRQMLEKDPKNRFSIEQCLNHEWFDE